MKSSCIQFQTIEDLLKKAKANKPVAEDDIPPPVSLGQGSRGASPVNVSGRNQLCNGVPEIKCIP